MPAPEGFYDLLFEISNEDRHGILLLIKGKALRITDIAKEMGLILRAIILSSLHDNSIPVIVDG
ncbi:MAG: hypothetical protein NTY03_15460 [Candidatus Bathyarchaeota archaeon]|nr:hypothetical protein [Candidatus Bathyarchaeota archaeon]